MERDKKYNNQVARENRIEFQKITQLINDNTIISNTSIMTFNTNFMIWAMLSDVKYLSLINAIFTPKTNNMIENDLIKSFKFLNLNVHDFKYFLRNKKENWRYFNKDVATFFYYTYSANSLTTFNNSKDFNTEVAEYIFASSPLYTQQIVIPRNEFDRFEKKFKSTELQNYNEPDTIILEKSMSVFKNVTIKQNYCKLYDGNFYILFFKKNPKIKCNL